MRRSTNYFVFRRTCRIHLGHGVMHNIIHLLVPNRLGTTDVFALRQLLRGLCYVYRSKMILLLRIYYQLGIS